jgi:nitrogen fixation protein FixH
MIQELKGWHVLTLLLAFFGVTIGVNALFITLALTSSTGEDQKKSYLQGLRYNEVIAAREAQARLGWSARISTRALPDGAFEIAIRFAGRDGAAAPVLSVEGRLRRPVQAHMDRPLHLIPAGNGVYRAVIRDLAAGRWKAGFTAINLSDRAQVFQAEAAIWAR